MAYDWPCNPGCTFDERHVGHCSTLDKEEEMAVGIVKVSASSSVCPFCKVQFGNLPPETHPETCVLRQAMFKFWRALPYILK